MASQATSENSSTNFFERARNMANAARDRWNESSTVTKALVIAVPTAVVAPLAIVPALGAVGFTSAGVAAGSIAASMQTASTAAGSLFALAQSAGATGAVAASTSAGVGIGSGLTAGGITALIFRRRRNNTNNNNDNNNQPSPTDEEPIVIDEQLNTEEHEAEEESLEQNISSDESIENVDQLALVS